MIRHPPRSTRPYTLFPDTTLFRSGLPLVVVNSQRAGPSTGMPTKTEQSDLHQAVFGRNGDSPVVVLAARSPADCFEVAIEAVRIATKFMTPVILLSDGYKIGRAHV